MYFWSGIRMSFTKVYGKETQKISFKWHVRRRRKSVWRSLERKLSLALQNLCLSSADQLVPLSFPHTIPHHLVLGWSAPFSCYWKQFQQKTLLIAFQKKQKNKQSLFVSHTNHLTEQLRQYHKVIFPNHKSSLIAFSGLNSKPSKTSKEPTSQT